MTPSGESDIVRQLREDAEWYLERSRNEEGPVAKREWIQAADAALTTARTEVAGPQIDSIMQTIVGISRDVAELRRLQEAKYVPMAAPLVSGSSCGKCGAWVPMGQAHFCGVS